LESTSNEEGEQGVIFAALSLASTIEMIWVNHEEWCKIDGISSIEILVIMGLG
jgi:hypothetical protein